MWETVLALFCSAGASCSGTTGGKKCQNVSIAVHQGLLVVLARGALLEDTSFMSQENASIAVHQGMLVVVARGAHPRGMLSMLVPKNASGAAIQGMLVVMVARRAHPRGMLSMLVCSHKLFTCAFGRRGVE